MKKLTFVISLIISLQRISFYVTNLNTKIIQLTIHFLNGNNERDFKLDTNIITTESSRIA